MQLLKFPVKGISAHSPIVRSGVDHYDLIRHSDTLFKVTLATAQFHMENCETSLPESEGNFKAVGAIARPVALIRYCSSFH